MTLAVRCTGLGLSGSVRPRPHGGPPVGCPEAPSGSAVRPARSDCARIVVATDPGPPPSRTAATMGARAVLPAGPAAARGPARFQPLAGAVHADLPIPDRAAGIDQLLDALG